ncbi:hypothetical protein G7Z17_g5123 [Cylindrodendrum hubeiense]|uniref:Uncharacterized protein n=1 Tax=Cylindrodendrum hubeiense TaxID=595255 RepID=A0A9P5H9I5_9HYPO|nr:hypothetical protein G7Z17_g5123 [Cylindrodendrum hubeiense]
MWMMAKTSRTRTTSVKHHYRLRGWALVTDKRHNLDSGQRAGHTPTPRERRETRDVDLGVGAHRRDQEANGHGASVLRRLDDAGRRRQVTGWGLSQRSGGAACWLPAAKSLQRDEHRPVHQISPFPNGAGGACEIPERRPASVVAKPTPRSPEGLAPGHAPADRVQRGPREATPGRAKSALTAVKWQPPFDSATALTAAQLTRACGRWSVPRSSLAQAGAGGAAGVSSAAGVGQLALQYPYSVQISYSVLRTYPGPARPISLALWGAV